MNRWPLILCGSLALSACSTHEVDTADEWCEQISGVDITEKYAPFWALLPGVRFHADSIRDDFARTLNRVSMESVQSRADRMAWREGSDLHVVNVGSLSEIEPEEVISQWKAAIADARDFSIRMNADRCVMGTVVTMFDKVQIHTWEWDALGSKVVSDNVTTIETGRRESKL